MENGSYIMILKLLNQLNQHYIRVICISLEDWIDYFDNYNYKNKNYFSCIILPSILHPLNQLIFKPLMLDILNHQSKPSLNHKISKFNILYFHKTYYNSPFLQPEYITPNQLFLLDIAILFINLMQLEQLCLNPIK